MSHHHARRLIAPLCATLLSTASAFAQDSVSVELAGTDGRTLGEATLTAVPSGVLIEAELNGLSPGEHGFHLHEIGLCEADEDFKSAGGHLAGDRKHGLLVEGGPHPGDMPNLHVPDSGTLHVEVLNTLVTLSQRRRCLARRRRFGTHDPLGRR